MDRETTNNCILATAHVIALLHHSLEGYVDAAGDSSRYQEKCSVTSRKLQALLSKQSVSFWPKLTCGSFIVTL